jgi:acetyl-CoA carboxylase alpha subunit
MIGQVGPVNEAMNERLREEFERIEARIQAHLQRIRDNAEQVQRIIEARDGRRPPELSAP